MGFGQSWSVLVSLLFLQKVELCQLCAFNVFSMSFQCLFNVFSCVFSAVRVVGHATHGRKSGDVEGQLDENQIPSAFP